MCEFKYCQELYSKIICPEKKFHSFPNGLHEFHQDEEYEEWADVLLTWTDNKLQTYKPDG